MLNPNVQEASEGDEMEIDMTEVVVQTENLEVRRTSGSSVEGSREKWRVEERNGGW